MLPALGVAAQTTTWRGEYYSNTTLGGTPILVRDDPAVNFDWGTGGPGSGLPSELFSVRWTTMPYFNGGTYNFWVTVDDGVRLWVDNQLLIDQWRDQPATTYSASKALGAGYHSVKIEYYQNRDRALCRAGWDTGSAPITDWRGEYFTNPSLSGSPAVVRNDPAVNFDWGYASPDPVIPVDHFSARWSRTAYFASSGNWTFSLANDDGARVWVNNQLIIDKWYPQSRNTTYATIYLAAGNHAVRVEYFESTGVAVCILNWALASGGGDEIIVDDLDGGFVRGGGSNNWNARSYGYRNRLWWSWNNQTTVRTWAKWFPYVHTADNYEVYVFIASKYFGTRNARYTVYHNGGNRTVSVNQSAYYDQWVSLGTYPFVGGGGEYVYLNSVTGEGYGTHFVGYDAVKFVRRGVSPVSPTPVPPPYATPTPYPGCSITPQLGFGRVWTTYPNVRATLNCPTEVEKSVWAGEEAFQGGTMFWRQDTNYIYVLYNNGTWQGFADTWNASEPEWDTSIVPPAGYYQPKRGFGKVWRNNAQVRNGLAWGTTEERGYNASLQQYQGGLMFWSDTRGIFAIYNNGRWERYD
jgi:hypothetical protein